ncbi:hypothetical protein C8R43DRAFT_1126492 [Mycena crocata]|nr:hypothetical protein C8R43DRAFT_1126492 [Mycena crocata]
MSRTTKAQLQSDLLHVAENLMVASIALEDDPDDTDLLLEPYLLGMDDDEADFLTDDIADVLDLESLNWMAIAQCMSGDGSRGSYDQIPKSVDFFSVCLRAPDREFRHMFRIGRNMFDYLVKELAENTIFHSTGRRPQRHVKYQLGCFLIRYGTIGSDTLGTAQKLSVGFGTVFLYCRRVTRAIRELRPRFLGWPPPERKAVIRKHIKDASGFPKCLGAEDGSLIRFFDVPIVDRHLYQPARNSLG